MKKLSICIPNYNRLESLKRLMIEIIRQITENQLHEQVQVCVSDDCSRENPEKIINWIKEVYPEVDILFKRNSYNMGMDYNFLQSVLMSTSEYCWIIGNDDLPENNGIIEAITMITKENIDILVTPFDIYNDENKKIGDVYPINNKSIMLYNTSDKAQFDKYLFSITHNSGLFGFLSNVIFKRDKWIVYKKKFEDKLNTIFIQMYMNIQTLRDGAQILYIPEKIIRNYSDDQTNNKIERIYAILMGLDGVVNYFFDGEIRQYLKRVIVDAYINEIVWNLPDEDERKKNIISIQSPKNELYKKFFISQRERKNYLEAKKVIIYGAGNYGKKVYHEIENYNTEIIGISDTDKAKEGKKFESFFIMSIDKMLEISRKQKVCIIVANHYNLEKMIMLLLENNVDNIAIMS